MNRANVEFKILRHQAQAFVKRHLLEFSPFVGWVLNLLS